MLDGSVMKMWLNAERSGNMPIADKFIVGGQEIELADSYAREQLNNINSGDVFIDDNVTSVDKVWSSQKVSQQLQQIGDLETLQTTDKSNVINAINEINSNSNATVFVGDTQPTNGALYWLDTSASSGTGGGGSGTEGEGGTTTEWTYDRSKWVAGKRYNGQSDIDMLIDDAKGMYYNELIPIVGKTTIRLLNTIDQWGWFDYKYFDNEQNPIGTAIGRGHVAIQGTAGVTVTNIPSISSYIAVSVTSLGNNYQVENLTLEVE